MFYWYFAHEDPDAPVVLWLNGGPGASSMFAVFLENGPLRVLRNGTTQGDYQLVAAEQSWADDYHLIFVDQPINTGFSYGNKSLTSEQEGSNEFLIFLQAFFLDKYPQLKTNDFYLTGESYAGKYLPMFTHDILENNKKAQPINFINLVKTVIIDPYPSPVN